MFKDFLNGFLASFRGIGLLFGSKKTMAIAGTPILLGVLSLIGFFSYVFPHYGPIHQYFEDFFVHTLGFTSQNFFMQFFVSSLVLLVVLAMLLASVYLLFLMTKLLASPFYGLLANQVFKIRGVKKAESLSIAHWIFLSLSTAC